MIDIYHNIDNAVKKYGLRATIAGANTGLEKVATQ